jgi:hypothetical protein
MSTVDIKEMLSFLNDFCLTYVCLTEDPVLSMELGNYTTKFLIPLCEFGTDTCCYHFHQYLKNSLLITVVSNLLRDIEQELVFNHIDLILILSHLLYLLDEI